MFYIEKYEAVRDGFFHKYLARVVEEVISVPCSMKECVGHLEILKTFKSTQLTYYLEIDTSKRPYKFIFMTQSPPRNHLISYTLGEISSDPLAEHHCLIKLMGYRPRRIWSLSCLPILIIYFCETGRLALNPMLCGAECGVWFLFLFICAVNAMALTAHDYESGYASAVILVEHLKSYKLGSLK